ncbi:MAG: hypothetical protein NVSMB21_11830 [Vulcanimicrobiaceae bacterium]
MKKEFVVAALLVLTVVASVAFAVVYATGAHTQAAAAALAVAFGSLAAATVVWEHELMARRESVEIRAPLASGADADDAAASAFVSGIDEIVGRRPWLVRLLGGAAAALGIAALFPLASFAPATASVDQLARTSWRKGSRLVREDGSVVRASDLAVNSIVTVFPEGHVGPQFANAMTNDATVLVRVPPEEVHRSADRTGSADGLLAFSKVCTHAGCPVALYRASARQLFCPCHQSTFDVLAGGARIFGPAARGLPQLPIEIAADGSLRALGDFPEPIGPGYWERG